MSLYVPNQEELNPIAAADIISQQAQALPDIGASFARMIVSLIILVALMFLTYWALRKIIQQRLQKANQDASIQILERRVISPKTTLYLVQVENRKVLMAESHLEVKRLESLPEQSE